MAKTMQVIGCAAAALLLLGLPLLVLLQRQQNLPHKLHNQMAAAATTAKTTTTTTTELSTSTARQQLLQLHRQKRYLVFPEGSSFQMVFDLIIPIVDYTNFAIMGITCAVAWELPSKPASELIENVRNRLNDGTLGVVRRNDSVPQQQQQQQAPTTATNWHALPAYPNQQQTKAATLTYDGYYRNAARPVASYANAYAEQQTLADTANWQQPPASRYQPHYDGNNNWWQHNKARIEQHWRQKQRLGEAYAWQPGGSSAAPLHRIYPVFGRRRRRRQRDTSIDLDLDFEQLHLRSHLTSRQLLFRKIERLYQAQKLNGTACVLRALCESAQRQRLTTQQPQSFIMELLWAIFQLPQHDEQEVAEARRHISPHYIEAHQQLGNCRELYSDCRHGFWLD